VKTSVVEERCAEEGATVASGGTVTGEAEDAVGATAVGGAPGVEGAVDATAGGATAMGTTAGGGAPVEEVVGAGWTDGPRGVTTVAARGRAAGAKGVPAGKDCTGPMGAGTKSV